MQETTTQTQYKDYPLEQHIPDELLRQIPKSAIFVAKVLFRLHHATRNEHTGQTNTIPSLKWIAKNTGYSVRTIHTAIHRLAALGIIQHIHRWAKKTKRYLTNFYYIPKTLYTMLRQYWKKTVLDISHVKKDASIVDKLSNNNRKIDPTHDGSGQFPVKIQERENEIFGYDGKTHKIGKLYRV